MLAAPHVCPALWLTSSHGILLQEAALWLYLEPKSPVLIDSDSIELIMYTIILYYEKLFN